MRWIQSTLALTIAWTLASGSACAALIGHSDSATLSIVGDHISTSPDSVTAKGNVVVTITGQDSSLSADEVIYDNRTKIIDAHGHVSITRKGQLTTGSAFKFKSSSDDYLVTEADTNVSEPRVSSRDDAETLKVCKICVEGNRLIPKEEILAKIKTKAGDPFDRDKIMDDLKAINSLGFFDSFSLQVTPERTSEGVLLKFKTTEHPPITAITFRGNKVISSDTLLVFFLKQLGKPQNAHQISQAIDKIEQAYRAKGNKSARVVDVHSIADGTIAVTIVEHSQDHRKSTIQLASSRNAQPESAVKLPVFSSCATKPAISDLCKIGGTFSATNPIQPPMFAQYRLGGWNGMRGYRAFSDLSRPHYYFLRSDSRSVLPLVAIPAPKLQTHSMPFSVIPGTKSELLPAQLFPVERDCLNWRRK